MNLSASDFVEMGVPEEGLFHIACVERSEVSEAPEAFFLRGNIRNFQTAKDIADSFNKTVDGVVFRQGLVYGAECAMLHPKKLDI